MKTIRTFCRVAGALGALLPGFAFSAPSPLAVEVARALHLIECRGTSVTITGRLVVEIKYDPTAGEAAEKTAAMGAVLVPLRSTVTLSTETIGARSSYSSVVCVGETSAKDQPLTLSLFSETVVRDSRYSASESLVDGQKIFRVATTDNIDDVRAAKSTAALLTRIIGADDNDFRVQIQRDWADCVWQEEPGESDVDVLLRMMTKSGATIADFLLSADKKSMLRCRRYASDGSVMNERMYTYANGHVSFPSKVVETQYTLDTSGTRVISFVKTGEIYDVKPVADTALDQINVISFFDKAKPNRVVDMRDGGKEKSFATLGLTK